MKTNPLLKSSLTLVTITILASLTAFVVRQGEVTKSAHLKAPKDILQFTSAGHVLGFAKTGVYVGSGSHALRVEFLNSHSIGPMSGAAPSAPDNANNAKRATQLSEVTYPNLWDGVTLTYDAPSGAIARSTYRLNPHAKVESIDLRYNAPTAIQKDGSLKISFKTGTITESAPKAWQEKQGKQVPIQVAFAQKSENEISFTVGQYDRSEPLFIDPTLAWSTFLGGGGGQTVGNSLAVDGSGNVYVAGYSSATWGSPVNAFPGGWGAFAAKLDSSGNLIWNTFFGTPGGNTQGYPLAVDGNGNVYVGGYSFATWGSPIRAFSSGTDAFVVKLDTNGNLIWNTFLGGSAGEYSGGMAVDGSGNVYVTGQSGATWGSPILAYSQNDAFVARLDSTGNLTWNTFLGSNGGQGVGNEGHGIAVDGSGNVYVAGSSSAAWGSPINAFSGGTGTTNAFAAKLDLNGNLTWNTFFGSASGVAYNSAIAVDTNGNVYVVGSGNATWGSPANAYSGGGYDAFVAKLDSGGNMTWNTFFGGSGNDFGGNAIAVDISGNVYAAGSSNATWGSPVNAYSASYDAFAAKLDATGNVVWNTFFGGSAEDFGAGLAVDGSGNVYVAGASYDTWGSPINAFSFSESAFVAKLSPSYAAQVQQPINADGSSVFSVKRGVVPVKFTLTSGGVATCQLPSATISLTRTAGTALGSIDESAYLLASDSGSNFRISDCQYVYNLATSSLGVGTYKVSISIGGTVVGSGTFVLK